MEARAQQFRQERLGSLLASCDGQLQVGGLRRAVIDALRGHNVVGRLRIENVGHERLRIPIVQGEPT